MNNSYPIPKNEKERLIQLLSYDILDTTPEDEYNQITKLASTLTKAPVALVSLIDTNRQWFKSCYGIDNLSETDRSISLCAHAIDQDEDIFIIENPLEDERFKHNPLVTGSTHVRFYAGVPLIDQDGFALGTLCVIDTDFNQINDLQKEQLKMLAKQVVKLMELRKANLQIKKDYAEFSGLSKKYLDQQSKLEDALQRAAKMSTIGEIAASIVHEIRNPLLIVSATADILGSMAEDNLPGLTEEVVSGAKTIDKALDRINKIINSLMNSARTMKDPFQKVSMRTVVGDCMEMISGKAKKGTVKVNIDCPPELCVSGRNSDLVQVAVNLINNSLDAMSALDQKGKWLNIKGEELGETIKVSISDCGSGIPKDIAANIFDTFYTTKEVGKGTGLGLGISQKLIEEHGGKLYYDDSAANTTFVIEIPKFKK